MVSDSVKPDSLTKWLYELKILGGEERGKDKGSFI